MITTKEMKNPFFVLIVIIDADIKVRVKKRKRNNTIIIGFFGGIRKNIVSSIRKFRIAIISVRV